MEGGIVGLQDGVIRMVTRNLTGMQVRFNTNLYSNRYLEVQTFLSSCELICISFSLSKVSCKLFLFLPQQ